MRSEPGCAQRHFAAWNCRRSTPRRAAREYPPRADAQGRSSPKLSSGRTFGLLLPLCAVQVPGGSLGGIGRSGRRQRPALNFHGDLVPSEIRVCDASSGGDRERSAGETIPAGARRYLCGRVRIVWHLVRILVVADSTQTDERPSVNVLTWLGQLFGSLSGQRSGVETREPPSTSETEARRVAAAWASENGKRWTLPANANVVDHDGRRLWSVESNAIGKGYRLAITIDDATGQVIAHREYPR